MKNLINPISLLSQNEEIFKRMSEDFDKLSKAVVDVQSNHMELASGVLELNGTYQELVGKMNLDSQTISSLQIQTNQAIVLGNNAKLDMARISEVLLDVQRKVQSISYRVEEMDSKIKDTKEHQLALSGGQKLLECKIAEVTKGQHEKNVSVQRSLSSLETAITKQIKALEIQSAALSQYRYWALIAGGIAIVAVILEFINAAL